ncbi:MAG TPA: IPT/TIG domain-containing protein [Bryobacteraceae bacterium]|nr:IPT/TIG domain-containing protein [Bryobacteraceae bacterium]
MTFSINLRLTCLLGFAALCPSFGQTPVVSAGGIVNAASFVNGQPVAAGSIVAIFGQQLAANLAQADTVPWSNSLGNVTVSFNGTLAPLQFVSAGQINAQVPWEAFPSGTGTANVVVNNNGALSTPQSVVVNPIVPGVFQSSGHAIAVNVTDPTSARYGTLAAPSGSIPGLTTFPAHVNDLLFFYANGLGPVDSPVASGNVPQSGQVVRTTTIPTVLVANAPAKVLFSGLTPGYPGIYQVNISVPQVPSGDAVPLQLQANGFTSPNTTNIAVQ